MQLAQAREASAGGSLAQAKGVAAQALESARPLGRPLPLVGHGDAAQSQRSHPEAVTLTLTLTLALTLTLTLTRTLTLAGTGLLEGALLESAILQRELHMLHGGQGGQVPADPDPDPGL